MNLKQVKGILTGRLGALPCPGNRQLALRAALDGMVLLKNEGALPLRGTKAALFGAGARGTVYCGTGSGYVFTTDPVTVEQGLRQAGMTVVTAGYLARCEAKEKAANKASKELNFIDRRWSGKFIAAEAPTPTLEELNEARRQTDTAIYVVRRTAGEENDRKAEKGDYYLSDAERADLETIADLFDHTVVVLNSCVVDLNFADEIPGIDGLVYMGLAGMEGGRALAELLLGRENFSGRLTDTFAARYSDYPAAAHFAGADGEPEHAVYQEDIYVGYRWFDTFGIEPLYPFGFGMSYTSFAMETLSARADWNNVALDVRVYNIGNVAGRQVVQVYVSAPQGRLAKPWQELRGYAKTGLIPPGGSETVSVSFPTESLSSFDAERCAWVMEEGDYLIRVGENSRSTAVAATLTLNGEAVPRRVSNILRPDAELHPPVPPKRVSELPAGIRLQLLGSQCPTTDNTSKIPAQVTTYLPEGQTYTPYIEENPWQLSWPCTEMVRKVRACPDATLLDVRRGNVSLEEFVASLPDEVLARIVTGTLEETPFPVASRTGKKRRKISLPQSSGTTTGQYEESLAIPQTLLFDGPAGVHIIGCAATAFPVGMVAAQSWDDQLLFSLGQAFARDMAAYHVSVLLGPGMNIHRDPLGGRSFEYYSEDPLLTGKTAAAFTRGVQKDTGRGVAVKHFAANEQETCRFTGNSTVSTRALREIYLRGFEIAVREAQPMTVMSSYNKLNGVHTSSNRELITDLLRGEWGFEGYVMTDWGTYSEKAFDLHAGNDLIMGGYRAEKLLQATRRQPPEFSPGGAVAETVKSSHFGMVKSRLDRWGSFVPCAGGKDTVFATVASGTSLAPAVLQAEKEGVAAITENADGSRTVTWYGTERGAYLARGELQACAMRILRVILRSRAMKELELELR